MDLTPATPQRSKSFKALSMAQPIRKDIEQTLNQLEQQKRRYIAADREETLTKQELQRKRTQLNNLKKQVPVTETNDKRSIQTHQQLKNTDRTYENVLGNIQKLRDQIDTARKRISKLKIYNEGLFKDQQQLTSDVDKLVEAIVQKEKANEDLKMEIVNYRELNLKNLSQFRKSHTNLAKSNFRDENQRRKYAVSTRTFLGEQQKMSRVVHFDKISDLLKNSGIATNQGRADVLADSIPIAKSRVNFIMRQNKQKIRIAENYMKFGEGLENMFNIIKEYKGRDDVDNIAEEFVKKQKQIQKLGQYIGKLEYQIVASKRALVKKSNVEDQLQKQLTTDNRNLSQKHYKEMSKFVKDEIAQLKAEHLKMNEWMKKVGEMLCPLAGDEDFSRGNAVNVMGKLEEKLGINRAQIGQRKQSPTKSHPAPPVEPEDHHQKYAQLLSYEKMKEYADEFIKNKKNA